MLGLKVLHQLAKDLLWSSEEGRSCVHNGLASLAAPVGDLSANVKAKQIKAKKMLAIPFMLANKVRGQDLLAFGVFLKSQALP